MKPVNRVASGLWVAAAIMAALQIITLFATFDGMRDLAAKTGDMYLALSSAVTTFGSSITSVALLIALGTLIELIDQIRWNAQSKD